MLTGDCEAATFLGKDKIAAGFESGLEVIARAPGGEYKSRFIANCKGDIEAIARHPDAMIIALCAEEETMTVKYFSYPSLSFVKDVCSFWRSGNSFSHFAVTKTREIVITDDANNQLRVYDLEGKALFVIPVSSVPAYSSIHCQTDNTILVSNCSAEGVVSKYKLFDNKAELVWMCEGLQNPSAVCTNEDGLIFTGSELGTTISMISPSGKCECYYMPLCSCCGYQMVLHHILNICQVYVYVYVL